MPRHTRGLAAAEDIKVRLASHQPKRQRVSLACDACRIAREKCDGGKPQCRTCTTGNRTCSYTPARRKRGIKTGYLRAVELSLAWILARAPEAEEALHRLYIENDGTAADQNFISKGKTSDRLYKKWTNSIIYNDIGKILSEERSAKVDTPTDDSTSALSPEGTDQDLGSVAGGTVSILSFNNPGTRAPLGPSQAQTSTTPAVRYPKLPSSWRHLADVYFTYTHCWLPVIQQEEVYFAAMLYTPNGLQITSERDPHAMACHAQLWAVLAIGSFQNETAGRLPQDGSMSAQQVYGFAKSLIPNDDANHERPMVCTMLLHALILMGKGNGMAAWLIIGRAARLILLTEHDFGEGGGVERRLLAKSPALAACCVLDTLLSICLGKPTQLALHVDTRDQSALFSLYPETAGPWRPLPGFGSASKAQPATNYPSLTLYQLLEFSLRMGDGPRSIKDLDGRERRANNDCLAQTIHPQLLFCSSLNVGASTPHIPSSLLLQVAFLSTSILVSGYRASLLCTLLGIVELSIECFGERGTPPLLRYFMESVEKHIDFEDLRPCDRTKWLYLLKRLRSPFRSDQLHENQNSQGSGVTGTSQLHVSNSFSHLPFVGSYQPNSRTYTREEHSKGQFFSTDSQETYTNIFPIGGHSVPSAGSSQSPALHTHNVHLQVTSHPSLPHETALGACPPIDYDAMLDELGSIDYTDNAELDAQFMTNLGFAPGCKTPDSVGDMSH
ncbi:Zn(2)-C6 fungal-type DNA-binding domain protein [Beauveria brongniartii RCEF 3172]|uniref:Zn(2)-C6 fungal-type DNA-binding domain protein n=1 Tax=Beauveria brongniartii RCEF 3172 TaxID=1081107 RepID=A0A167F2B2_9HYPO|nr:Zn(2)-C6 fungal-type DNA-binding domain protein [Beauveria brongniartii RCEF 3172]